MPNTVCPRCGYEENGTEGVICPNCDCDDMVLKPEENETNEDETMKTKFMIKDWAGNICFHGKEFNSFEDGWDFIREKYDHLNDKDHDDQLGEYSVVTKDN